MINKIICYILGYSFLILKSLGVSVQKSCKFGYPDNSVNGYVCYVTIQRRVGDGVHMLNGIQCFEKYNAIVTLSIKGRVEYFGWVLLISENISSNMEITLSGVRSEAFPWRVFYACFFDVVEYGFTACSACSLFIESPINVDSSMSVINAV